MTTTQRTAHTLAYLASLDGARFRSPNWPDFAAGCEAGSTLRIPSWRVVLLTESMAHEERAGQPVLAGERAAALALFGVVAPGVAFSCPPVHDEQKARQAGLCS